MTPVRDPRTRARSSRLRFVGAAAVAAVWPYEEPQPDTVQVHVDDVGLSSTARGVGYYTYAVLPDAVLEELEITVP